jgi:hypothetical protein
MSEKSIPIEINLRGACLKVSVTIENILQSVVYASNAEQYTIKGSKYLKLKGCMFGQKIEKVKELLQKFHPDLLQINETLFEDLSKFKEFRNKMAHCAFTWSNRLDEFDVWDISEDENKFQYFEPSKYTVFNSYMVMDDALKKIVPELVKMLRQIEARLKEANPKIYDELKLGDNSPEAS